MHENGAAGLGICKAFEQPLDTRTSGLSEHIVLSQAVSAKLDSLAQEGNSIQSDSQHETNGKAAEAAADQVESRPKSGITHQEKPKNAEGAALSWPKRSNKRK